MTSDLVQEMLDLQPGEHLCLFYDQDPAEQLPALVPFIRDGLARNEQFVYIADDFTVEQLAERLEQSGIDVRAERARGGLKLWTRAEWRQPGELSSEKKAMQVRQFIKSAMAAGFKGIRFAVEMTWTVGPDISAEQLEHWEATLNSIFTPGFPGRIVCQYNQSRLAPEVLLAALRTHPVAILGQQVCPNPYYQAPLILNGHSSRSNGNGHENGNGNGNGHNHNSHVDARVRVGWMVSQLKRARAAGRQREELSWRRVARAEAELAQEKTQEITERKKAEGLQQALYDLVARINHASGLSEIYDAALDAICRCLNADRASILLCDSEGIMRFEAWRGLSEAYRRAVEGHCPWQPNDPDPQPVWIDNIDEAVLEDRLRGVIQIEGIQSLAFVPITHQNRLVGKFMIYFNTPHHFSFEEIRPAQTIASQITFAIERQKNGLNLERLVNERTASLREAIAQMEEFSYSVSHDLRAPVRAMQGYARAVLEDYGHTLDPQSRDYLDRIVRGSLRMDRLIQDILTYSLLSRREIRLLPVSLDKLVREIIEQYPEMHARRDQISTENPLMDVIAHEPSLSQAVSNLLNNAVKFVPLGTVPHVRVRTERRENQVRLWIEDNGIGIKPEYQHRLFGMFERVHSDTHYEGTGIGLAIVRKAVERMGGKVGVESDGLTGSRFWVQLQAASDL